MPYPLVIGLLFKAKARVLGQKYFLLIGSCYSILFGLRSFNVDCTSTNLNTGVLDRLIDRLLKVELHIGDPLGPLCFLVFDDFNVVHLSYLFEGIVDISFVGLGA